MFRQCIIGIPTFNRPEDVNQLITKIYNWKHEKNLNMISHVIIADNSDCRNTLCSDICTREGGVYIWDGKNHGYGENIRRLIRNAKNYYLWLLGDDDIIDIDTLIKLNSYLLSNNPINNYITFSSVLNNKYFSLDSKSKNISSSKFLEKEWKSVIFLSGNIFFVSEKLIDETILTKTSKVFENSILAFKIIRDSKEITILNTFTPQDSYTEKLYYPKERFDCSLISYLDVTDSLFTIKSISLKFDLINQLLSKYISAIYYSLFFDLHGFKSSINSSIKSTYQRLKDSKLNKLYLVLFLLINLLYYCFIPILVLNKFKLGKILINKSIRILMGRKRYEISKNKFLKVLSANGMNYIT